VQGNDPDHQQDLQVVEVRHPLHRATASAAGSGIGIRLSGILNRGLATPDENRREEPSHSMNPC
jgi:hypothetical protein